MECLICESNNRVIRLVGGNATSRFNICEDCIAKIGTREMSWDWTRISNKAGNPFESPALKGKHY